MLSEFVLAGLNGNSAKACQAYEEEQELGPQVCSTRVYAQLKFMLCPEYCPESSDESSADESSDDETRPIGLITSADLKFKLYPMYLIGALTHRFNFKITIRHDNQNSDRPRIEAHGSGWTLIWPERRVEINRLSTITTMTWYNSSGQLHRDGHLPAHISAKRLVYCLNGCEYLRVNL